MWFDELGCGSSMPKCRSDRKTKAVVQGVRDATAIWPVLTSLRRIIQSRFSLRNRHGDATKNMNPSETFRQAPPLGLLTTQRRQVEQVPYRPERFHTAAGSAASAVDFTLVPVEDI